MAKARDVRSKLLELLAENPSISAACRKLSINRMMFYRLKKSDADFKRNVKLAMIDGRTKWVEIAELGLMSLVKEKNLGAIKFFLANNDLRYAQKYSIDAIPPEEREEYEKRKKESAPVHMLSEESTKKILDSMKRFGLLNEDGSPTEKSIKENPEFYLQIIREDEARKRRQKGLPD
jgi:hypothetical protein